MYVDVYVYVYIYLRIHIYLYQSLSLPLSLSHVRRAQSWISRKRFIRSSNQIPCLSNVLLCCFEVFSDSSNRGMSKQYPLTVFLNPLHKTLKQQLHKNVACPPKGTPPEKKTRDQGIVGNQLRPPNQLWKETDPKPMSTTHIFVIFVFIIVYVSFISLNSCCCFFVYCL